MTIRTIIIDDHAIVREGIRALIEKEPDMEVIAEADDGLVAMDLVDKFGPDIVIVDIAMPYMNGIEVIRRIHNTNRVTKVIVLSMHSDKRFVYRALNAGAHGYMVKDCAAEELVRAIRAVIANQTYLSPAITGEVVEGYLRNLPNTESGYLSMLTPRECEILKLIADGISVKEIASIFNISVKTVETHRQRIMSKLNINNTAELIKFAIREGLISLEN